MSTFLQDASTKHWMILSPVRQNRPQTVEPSSSLPICPFCPGNESQTPPEVFRMGIGEPDSPGWQVRVVPNKYPITDIHEVIIHAPDHPLPLELLPINHIKMIFTIYQQRYLYHKRDGTVVIFCNQGKSAGASLVHPHSQLVVIPENMPLTGISIQPVVNVITETDYFFIYCPAFSEWPYEVCIAPKTTEKSFDETTEEELKNLSETLPKALRALKQSTENHEAFDYNYFIAPGKNWFLRIIPRIIYRAGFEYATGILVNTVDPKEAAEKIKEYF